MIFFIDCIRMLHSTLFIISILSKGNLGAGAGRNTEGTGATSPRIDFARRATPGLLLLPSDTSSHYKKNARQIIGKETFDLRLIDFRIQIRQKPLDEMDDF